MTRQPTTLVSVIIPFLNEGRFIKECIESVIQQQYANWEMILVDDGSSDISTKIAKDYAGQKPGKIIYADHEGHVNKGISASRNLGIAKAKGELVAFLDADDIWTPEKLEKQVGLFQQNQQAAMVCEGTKYWYSWDNPDLKNIDTPVGAALDKLYYPPQLAMYLYPLGQGAAPCMCGVIIKMSVLETIGGFDESFVRKNQLYEDQAFLIKIYLNEIAYVSSLCNNHYRQRPDSDMHTIIAEGNYLSARHFFLHYLENYLQEHCIQYPAVHALLQKALRLDRYSLKYKTIRSMRRCKQWIRLLVHRYSFKIICYSMVLSRFNNESCSWVAK